MGERTTITASYGFTLNAYRAEPEGKPRGGVVVIQEVWGLNDWVRSVVDRYAEHGFVAVAPAMFDRVGLGLSAASGYYGGGVPNYIELAPTIPLEMHFGDQDSGIPLEQIEALKARYPDVPIHVYAAGHGFCNSDRPASFDLAACTKASARTLDFFRKHLG